MDFAIEKSCLYFSKVGLYLKTWFLFSKNGASKSHVFGLKQVSIWSLLETFAWSLKFWEHCVSLNSLHFPHLKPFQIMIDPIVQDVICAKGTYICLHF